MSQCSLKHIISTFAKKFTYSYYRTNLLIKTGNFNKLVEFILNLSTCSAKIQLFNFTHLLFYGYSAKHVWVYTMLWVNWAALILKIFWYVCSIPKIFPASWKLCQLIATFAECPSALTSPGVNRFDFFFFKHSILQNLTFWETLISIFHI